MTEPRIDLDRVVYLAYGSNTDPDRMACYIMGSDERSPFGAHVGSTDRRPVRTLGSSWVQGRLYFGGSSLRWGGGVALADWRWPRSELFVVRYEVSRQQLSDLVSQENRGAPVEVDWERLADTGRCKVAAGLYDTLVSRSQSNEVLLTSGELRTHNAPVDRYVQTLRRGLSRYLPGHEAERYIVAAVAAGPSGQECQHEP